MKPMITNGMFTMGSFKTYRNKRELRRRLRQLSRLLVQSVPMEYLKNTVWKITKPVIRAHDPLARVGFISWTIKLPEELLCNQK